MTEAKLALDKVTKPYQEVKAKYDELDNKAKNYKASQRVFETHIARIEIAMHCKADPACLGGTLTAKFDDIKPRLDKWIKGLDGFTPDEKAEIVAAQIERAMLDLGKMGDKGGSQTEALLTAARSDDRLIRQSVLLALPKIAGKACKDCGAKLDAAIAAGQGKTTLGDLNYETQVLRSYFSGDAGDSLEAPTP